MLVASAGFALMGAGVKLAAGTASALETAFLRSASGALLVLPLVLARGETVDLSRWATHLARSIAGIVSMLLYFASLVRLPVSTAIALNGTSGLFLPLLAWAFLAERPSRRALAGVACGFAGVLLVVGPRPGNDATGLLLALSSGGALALAHVSIRRLGREREPVLVQVLAFNVLGTAMTGLLLVASGDWRIATAALPWGAAIGVAATLGQFGLVSALALGPTAQVAAVGFTSFVIAAGVDAAVLGVLPPTRAWPGLALVLAGAWLSSLPARRAA